MATINLWQMLVMVHALNEGVISPWQQSFTPIMWIVPMLWLLHHSNNHLTLGNDRKRMCYYYTV
jgi:uncharacterized RDD family membrane protein YckC